MKSRSRFVSYLGETLVYQESKPLAPEILDDLVTRLREGDRSVANQIIIGHLRLVMSILARHSLRASAADIEGAALLSLVESVHRACPYEDEYGILHESSLTDNNITAYITANVHYAIKDEFANNHTVRVPPRTVRDKIAKGEKFEDIVPGSAIEVKESNPRENGQADSDSDNYGASNAQAYVMPFFVPIAKIEFPAIEFTELLDLSAQSLMDQAILDLRKQGYTYEEIGKRVGYSMPRIQQFVNSMADRYDGLNK